MTISELTGRDLDCAVATAMGWTDVAPHPYYGMDRPQGHPPHGGMEWVPHYSAADCSGVAPVLAWLEANGPTVEEVERYCGGVEAERGAVLALAKSPGENWYANYSFATLRLSTGERLLYAKGSTLPEAAARLLVAWAGRKGKP